MDNSSLSRLSGELSNMIYSYLCPDRTEAVICLCGRHHPLRSHLCNPKTGELWTYTGSHLPRVCRQLRYETLSHFFSSNDFVLPLRYILQAGEQFRLEDEWERFVQLFGANMVRQIKRLTVHAGNINEVRVERPSHYTGKKATERELLDRGFAIYSDVDLQCAFARRCVRPCLHHAARMLVVFEHQKAEGKITCINFDDRDATAARIQKVVGRDYGSWTWEHLWPDLLAKWYGDSVLCSDATEDAISNLMLLGDVSDEAVHHGLDRDALAGLLNIVRPRDLGPRLEMDEDAEISTDDFMAAYAPFSGRQMAFAHKWEEAPGGLAVAIDTDTGGLFESLTRCLQNSGRAPEELLQRADRVDVIALPDMERVFEGSPLWLWDWERLFRLDDPHVLRGGRTVP